MNENNQESYFAVIPANVRYDKELRANEKLIYGEISALTNKFGYCWASNKYFADLYGVTTQAISKWILHLEKRGYIVIEYKHKENSKEIDKRFIRMVSTYDLGVSTNVDGGINKCLGGYQQMFKDNNTSDNNTSINNTINKYNNEFEQIWKEYPRKQGKSVALKAYIKARKNGVDKDTILTGIKNYVNSISQNKTERRYIKQGSTWFNQECWNDEYNAKPRRNDLDDILR